MTLGDVKIQTLKLMEINNADITVDLLPDLISDENYKEYLSRMPSSVTRAMNRIKTVGAVPKKSYEFPEETDYYMIKKIALGNEIEDFSKLERIVVSGHNTYCGNYPYTFEGENVVLFNIKAGNTITVIYEPKMPVFTTLSDDALEIPLPEELASIIPYFVKADVFEQDEPELATQARNIFELMLAEYIPQNENIQHFIQSDYSQRW